MAAETQTHLVETIRQPEIELTDREAMLKTVLSPADYEYVKDTKLDELFYHDDEGADGLRHILAGELRGSMRVPAGFHHNRSGQALSGINAEGEPLTHIEQVVDEDGNSIDRPLMAPYEAAVKIDGREKVSRRRVNGELTFVPGTSTMFPEEYDALMIMRTVQMAIQNADPAHDSFRRVNDNTYYGLMGKVPMIDGTSEMAVKVVVDFDTMTVLTAYPVMAHSDRLELTPDEAMHHATYGLSSATGKLALTQARAQERQHE